MVGSAVLITIVRRAWRVWGRTDVEGRDLGGRAGLLAAELVAREEQQPQPAPRILAAEGDEPGHLVGRVGSGILLQRCAAAGGRAADQHWVRKIAQFVSKHARMLKVQAPHSFALYLGSVWKPTRWRFFYPLTTDLVVGIHDTALLARRPAACLPVSFYGPQARPARTAAAAARASDSRRRQRH